MTTETPGPITISASQLSTFSDCPRKWAFDKLDGVPRGETEATNEGKAIHDEVEQWYLHGTPPKRKAALALLAHLPERGPQVVPEVPFEFVWPGLDYLAHGFVDLNDYAERRVYDHKTVRSLSRSLKTAEELRLDAQGVLYSVAMRVLTKSTRPVSLQWTYVVREEPKTRPPKTELVTLDHTDADVEEGLAKWTPVAAEILRLRKAGGRALDVLPNTDACMKYGPCQYRDLCPDYGRSSKPQPQEDDMSMDLLARLAAASAAPMTATPTAQAEASARNPMDEITSDPSMPTAPKMGLLDTLRVDDTVTPAIKPPDAQPNVSPTEPALPEAEVVTEKPAAKRRGRPPKTVHPEQPAALIESALGEAFDAKIKSEPLGAFFSNSIETDELALIKTMDEAARAEREAERDEDEYRSATEAKIAELKAAVDNAASLAERQVDVKFVYEAPKSLDVNASDFDLEAFVESVCEKAARVDDLDVRLQAARIAVDLLAVRKS